MREERARGGPDADLINNYIAEGKIVPIKITVQLIKNAMEKAGWEKNVYLIDGFPRSEENLQGWNEVIGDSVDFCGVIYFAADEQCMTDRIMERAKSSGRIDDNLESLKKRFVSFRNDQLPIIQHFQSRNLVHEIDAQQPIEEVYACVKAAIKGHL